LLALVLSVCVAATRLILGVHWLSDLVIGMLIGIPWGRRLRSSRSALGRRTPRLEPYLLGCGSVHFTFGLTPR
jgi:membrane-associated phospholipid phosphatase